MAKDPQKMVDEMRAQVGKPRTKRLLQNEGIKDSMAEKLSSGTYKSEVSYRTFLAIGKAYEKAMKAAS